MAVELNHTIVHANDPAADAAWLAELFDLADPEPFGPFMVVTLANGVSLDFIQAEGDVWSEHYAFLVGEDEFDTIYGRIRERGMDHWADPARSEPGQINHHDGGRGVYFEDPSGHFLEIITRPYGSGGD